MKLTEIYESETGEKATYRMNSSDYHTLRYVRWLEVRAQLYDDSCEHFVAPNFCGNKKYHD